MGLEGFEPPTCWSEASCPILTRPQTHLNNLCNIIFISNSFLLKIGEFIWKHVQVAIKN